MNRSTNIESKFLREFNCDYQVDRLDLPNDFLLGASGARELFSSYSGASFGGGVYRLHSVEMIKGWNDVVGSAFPEYDKRIECFGFDWLGRVFALDSKRMVDEEPGVLMLEPGTGHALEIPANFASFHGVELIEYAEAALALSAYDDWKKGHKNTLKHDECVGYKVPLFLSGEDILENMELTNMAIYWDICAQLLEQTRKLPDGAMIRGVKIEN